MHGRGSGGLHVSHHSGGVLCARLGDELRGIARSFAQTREHPWLSLAYCAYALWMSGAIVGPALRVARIAALPPLVALLVPFCLVGVFCLVLALWFKRTRTAFDQPEYRAFVVATMMLGSLCHALAALGLVELSEGGEALLYVLGCLFTAVGMSLFRIEMDRAFGWIGARRTLFHALVGTLLMLPLGLLVTFVPTLVGLALTTLLPVLAMALLSRETRRFPHERYYGWGARVELPVPTQFIATSFVQGVALGVLYAGLCVPGAAGVGALVGAFGAAGQTQTLRVVGLVALPLGALLVLLTTMLIRMDYNRLLYKVGFPLVALGFVLLSVAPGLTVPGELAFFSACIYLDLILWSLGAFIMKSMGMPAVWIASFPGAGLYLGTAAGVILMGVAGRLVPQGVPTVLAACLMLAASLFLLSDRNLRSGWGTFQLGSRKEVASSLEAALSYPCVENALTPREAEVVRYLADGLTRQAVAAEMSVSEETVKTHTRGIYRKLDVHSQAELVQLVEKTRAFMRDAEARDHEPDLPGLDG